MNKRTVAGWLLIGCGVGIVIFTRWRLRDFTEVNGMIEGIIPYTAATFAVLLGWLLTERKP